MAQSNRDYWRKREEEARRHEIKDEEEYRKRLAEIYRYMQSNIEKEINGFYARYAAKNGITMAEARKRASKADMEGLARKAAKYVAEKDFSDQANEEMALYNLAMKANRLELLKANIGLELVDGFNDVEKEIRADLTETALKEYARMAGILGASVRGSEKHARVLVNASFRNATFSERVWASQSVLKSNLERLLTIGIIQGRNPNVLMTEVVKAMKVSEYEARRLLVTEMCRLQTEVQKESYERNGYEQYIIITCGEDACEECQKMDGRVFFVKDMAPGDNAPPFHPSCRCSTAEYADRGRLEELIGQVEKERGEDVRWNEFESRVVQTQKKTMAQGDEKNRVRTYGKAPIYDRNEVIDKCESFEDIKALFPEISFFNNFNKIPLEIQKEVAQGFYYMRELFGDKALPWTCGSSKMSDYGKTKMNLRKMTINSSINIEDAFSTACHECIHVMDYNRGLLSDRIIEKSRKKLGLKNNSRKMDELILDILGWQLYNKYRHDNSELTAYAFEEYLFDSDNELVMAIIEQFIGELR